MVVSARWRPGLEERLRAAPFLDPYAQRRALGASDWRGVPIADLQALARRVVGGTAAKRAFTDFADSQGIELTPGTLADRSWIQFTERLLAAAIGAASSRLVMTSTLRGSGMELAEVMAVLDEAGQELRFNREILSSTLENIDPGVSVVDRDMLVAGTGATGAIRLSRRHALRRRPIAGLIRYNAERGELGELTEEDQPRSTSASPTWRPARHTCPNAPSARAWSPTCAARRCPAAAT